MSDNSRELPEWRAVPGFEGSYQVSDLGDVRSLPRWIYPSNGRPRRHPGHVLKPTPGSKGHLIVSLGGGPSGKKKYCLVHRLVLLAFVGECPPGMEGCHGDGNPGNNRLDNLRWDTSTANHLDMVRHGRNFHLNKKVCKFGHRLELPNLVRHKLPNRGCRSCARSRSQVDHQLRRYGREIDFLALANAYYAEVVFPGQLDEAA